MTFTMLLSWQKVSTVSFTKFRKKGSRKEKPQRAVETIPE